MQGISCEEAIKQALIECRKRPSVDAILFPCDLPFPILVPVPIKDHVFHATGLADLEIQLFIGVDKPGKANVLKLDLDDSCMGIACHFTNPFRPVNALLQKLVKGTHVRGHMLVVVVEKETGHVAHAETELKSRINCALAR
ncbi:hypothetical protein CC1G_11348 [Coprinopsis cinerea okayama7|uniref:Uncharacterized protein n=1 Tax=Coprinopsis cinerea (strain Okayama-7 / 130 / ATCC MYA-4618 / FGSC 9003) TaxID=240176 RepID=A8P8U6_COPC7|nr:hypothetical protein CC1G_11348 [Coprinopsis cinerea okayama7\|eukprot:XP_001839637.2 hypothetical protein CC1G_11348 [Coprinopsis cinerea okayama7\